MFQLYYKFMMVDKMEPNGYHSLSLSDLHEIEELIFSLSLSLFWPLEVWIEQRLTLAIVLLGLFSFEMFGL